MTEEEFSKVVPGNLVYIKNRIPEYGIVVDVEEWGKHSDKLLHSDLILYKNLCHGDYNNSWFWNVENVCPTNIPKLMFTYLDHLHKKIESDIEIIRGLKGRLKKISNICQEKF